MGRELQSCLVCSGPLSNGSLNGVCPVCMCTQVVMGLARDTVRPAATVGPAARVHATDARPDVPLPPNPPGLVLVRRLGSGGMGAVYLGVDAETRRFVAVKLLHAPGEPGVLERFQAEVRALAELAHPNIVGVFAANLHHHAPYCTMEHVPGGTLARFVGTRGRLEPIAAANLISIVARAAHSAHRRGIVHRDIKPGNVLLGLGAQRVEDSVGAPFDPAKIGPDNWVPKLSDFGLAKRTDRNDGLTVGFGALGTPGFMAPEQAAGGPVSPRTDVYGLGATLYHALTGRAPFESDDARDVVDRVQSAEPPRVRLLRPEVPVELEAIVHKCLEKDPAARYPSAEDLAADLDRFAAGQSVLAKPLTRFRRARRAVARNRGLLVRSAAAVLAVFAAVAAGAAGRGSRADQAAAPDPLELTRAELDAGKAVTLVGATGEPRWRQWVHGPSAFAPCAGRDNACSYQVFGPSMLDLCPNPMTDRYQIRAELCQTDVSARGDGVYEFGLYFGRQPAVGNAGWRAESCFAIRLSEFPNVAPGAAAVFGRLLVTESPTQRPTAARWSVAKVPFTQSAALPGPWRVIEVEVTPEGVKAWLGDSDGNSAALANVPADDLQKMSAERHDVLDKVDPNHGIAFPAWNPRGAIGLWAFGSAVAVRNVTVTPLK